MEEINHEIGLTAMISGLGDHGSDEKHAMEPTSEKVAVEQKA